MPEFTGLHCQVQDRDLELLGILEQLPLTTEQLLTASPLLSKPFNHIRVLRRRLNLLEKQGLLRPYRFAIPTSGRNPYYWRLTRVGYRLLHELTPSDPLPSRYRFTAIPVSLHKHTLHLNKVVVKFLLNAQQHGLSVSRFRIEKTISIPDDDRVIVPDAELELLSSDGRRYTYFIELDTGSERISTLQTIPASIQKKLEFYELYRRSGKQFRTVFVTTSSERRAVNILKFCEGMTHNDAAHRVYASFFKTFMDSTDCLFDDQVFMNHNLNRVPLVPSRNKDSNAVFKSFMMASPVPVS